MSVVLRRTASWTATLVLLCAAGVGVRQLPGAGGRIEELRWLLGRAGPVTRHFNQASAIFLDAEAEQWGAGSTLFSTLLTDSDPRVVRNAMMVLGDQMRVSPGEDALQEIFLDWFCVASVKHRLAFHPGSSACCEAILENAARSGPTGTPMASLWPRRLSADDRRWIVAMSLPSVTGRFPCVGKLLATESATGPEMVRSRLWFVDAGTPIRNSGIGRRFERLGNDDLRHQLCVDPDDLLDMLSDPLPEVRHGAARILAVAGDERGLKVFCKWLRPACVDNAATEELLSELYGPDWRQGVESCDPARP